MAVWHASTFTGSWWRSCLNYVFANFFDTNKTNKQPMFFLTGPKYTQMLTAGWIAQRNCFDTAYTARKCTLNTTPSTLPEVWESVPTVGPVCDQHLLGTMNSFIYICMSDPLLGCKSLLTAGVSTFVFHKCRKCKYCFVHQCTMKWQEGKRPYYVGTKDELL